MKAQLFASAALVLLNAIPGALSAEPKLRGVALATDFEDQLAFYNPKDEDLSEDFDFEATEPYEEDDFDSSDFDKMEPYEEDDFDSSDFDKMEPYEEDFYDRRRRSHGRRGPMRGMPNGGNSREWDGNCGHLGESNCGSVSNRKCTTNDEGKCVPVGSPVQAPSHHSPPSPPNGLTSTNIQRGQSVDIDCGTSGACCVEGNFKSTNNRGVQQFGGSPCANALTSASLHNCQSRPCIATCSGKCEVKVQARGRRGPKPRKSSGNNSGGSSVCDGGQASNCGSLSTDDISCTWTDNEGCVVRDEGRKAPSHHSPPSPPNGLTSTNIQRGESVDIDCGTSGAGACCVEGNFKSEINRGPQQIDLRGSSSCPIGLTSASLRNCQSRPCIATCRGKCEVKVQARGRRGPSPTPRRNGGNSSGGSSVCDGGQASNCGSHSTDEIHCTWTDNGCVARDGIDMV